MTITWQNGTWVKGALLSESEGTLRVAVHGADDALEFVRAANGAWVSEDCEPVEIEFDLEVAPAQLPAVDSLDDYICPPELAARLISLLSDDSSEAEWQACAGVQSLWHMTPSHRIV